MTYREWIDDFVAKCDGKLLGKCREAVEAMHAVFPELRIVRGHAPVMGWGLRGHWWLITPDGTIVDPTEEQFPGVMQYEEWRPGDAVRIGKCMECGDEIWADIESLDDGPPPHETFCSDDCRRSFASALTGEL
jgi:hypothetical protein